MDMFDYDSHITDVFEWDTPQPAPHKETISHEDKMQHALQKCKTLLESQTGKNVTMLVFIDATSSMERNIRRTRGGIMSMYRALQDMGCALRVGGVAYRDPVDCPTADEHTVIPVTGSKLQFHNAMKAVKAKGGGDGAEDWAGGMEKLNVLLDDVPTGDAVIFCHVSDAPPHGLHSGYVDDNHNTEEQRDRLRQSLLTLQSKLPEDFEYLYFPVDNQEKHANNYRRFLAETLGTEWVRNYFRVTASHDFELSFVSSVFESVTRSSGTSTGIVPATDVLNMLDLEGVLKEEATTSSKVDKTAFLRVKVDYIEAPKDCQVMCRDLMEYGTAVASAERAAITFHGFLRHVIPTTAKVTPTSLHGERDFTSDTVLDVERHAFAHGKERFAFAATLYDKVSNEMQEKMCTDAEAICELKRDDSKPVVVKLARIPREVGFSESKMAVHVAAMGMAKLWQEHVNYMIWNHFYRLRILAPMAITFPEGKVRMMKQDRPFIQTNKLKDLTVLAESRLPDGGDFVKFITNDGTRNTAVCERLQTAADTVDAFILFCAIFTRMKYVPSDIQGMVDRSRVLWLTDLAATCSNPLAFQESGTNLGEMALRRIVKVAFQAFRSRPHFAEVFGPTGRFKNAGEWLDKETKDVKLIVPKARSVKRKRPATAATSSSAVAGPSS